MASFTAPNSVRQYTPYIAQQPTEAMLAVGQNQERKFEEGIQKVQNYVDTISGLDISKDSVKQYVTQRMGDLKKGITDNLSGDFSDQRIVNQIGGAASALYKDPIVQNGVIATANARANYAKMSEDEKAGKLSPANRFAFENPYNQWLTDGQLDTQLNASYSTDWGIHKNLTDALESAHKQGIIDEQTWQTQIVDGNGNIDPTALIEQSRKGVTPGKVREIINTVLSQPGAQQQLQIDADYRYRGATPLSLYDNIKGGMEQANKAYSQTIQQLQTEYNAANSTKQKQIQEQIRDLNAQYAVVRNNFDKATGLLTNPTPEGVAQSKNLQYQNELINQYSNAYSWEQISKKQVESPSFKAALDQAKYSLDVSKFQYQQQSDAAKFAQDERKLNEEIRKNTLQYGKGKGLSGGTSTDNLPISLSTITQQPLDAQNPLTQTTFEQNVIGGAQADVDALQPQIVDALQASANPDGTPAKRFYVDGKPNIDPNNPAAFKSIQEWEREIKPTLTNIFDNTNNGTINSAWAPMATQLQEKTNLLRQYKEKAEVISAPLKEVQKDLNKIIPEDKFTLGINAAGQIDSRVTSDDPQSGRMVTFTRDDLVNYYIYEKNIGNPQTKDIALNALGKVNKAVQSGVIGNLPQYKQFKQLADNKPDLVGKIQKVSQDFQNLQRGMQGFEGNLDVSKPENKRVVNDWVKSVIQNQTTALGEEASSELLALTADENMKNYTPTIHENTDGNFTLTLNYNDKKGDNTTKQLTVTRQDIQNNISGAITEPTYFSQSVKPLLTLNDNRGTTRLDVNNPQARSTALKAPQGNIGKYDFRYHLKSIGGRYVMHGYIRDSKTGALLANGIQIDPTLLLPKNATPEQIRAAQAFQTLDEDGLTKLLSTLQESDLDTIIKNAR